MTRAHLPSLSVTELVELFAQIALAQDEAIFADDYAKASRLYWEMDSVRKELKAREGDQRRVLLKLFDFPNIQVRLKAAVATLAVAPEEARAQLQTIADSREYPQAGDAGMTLVALDRGTFKPT